MPLPVTVGAEDIAFLNFGEDALDAPPLLPHFVDRGVLLPRVAVVEVKGNPITLPTPDATECLLEGAEPLGNAERASPDLRPHSRPVPRVPRALVLPLLFVSANPAHEA